MYKTNQLTGHVYNDSEVKIKVKEDTRFFYAKNVFLARKDKQRDREPTSFWAFTTDRNDAFSYPFIYFSW